MIDVESELLSKGDIFLNQTFENPSSYYKRICEHLFNEQKIDSEYLESVEKREKQFPTGLKTGRICVAIPHTDYQYSKTTQLVITTLKDPVYFRRMDDPSKECAVNIIIQILFDNPKKQLLLLQELMKIIQNQNFLRKVIKAKDKDEIVNLFKEGK